MSTPIDGATETNPTNPASQTELLLSILQELKAIKLVMTHIASQDGSLQDFDINTELEQGDITD